MSNPACGGSGAYLTATFQEYTFGIVGSGTSLDLRIEAHMDDESEEVAFDFFQIKSDSALPIKMQGFNAKKERGNVILDWATASEVNNAYFLVEHSLDGKRFQEIGMVHGAGNSTMVVEYDFVHEAPSSGVNYYRLKQVDFDGEFSYSPIVDVNFKSETDKITISPNPFNAEISLSLDNAFDTDVNIKIYDPIGRLVISQMLSKGHNQKMMNLSDLDSGVYFLQIGEGNNRIIQKITKY